MYYILQYCRHGKNIKCHIITKTIITQRHNHVEFSEFTHILENHPAYSMKHFSIPTFSRKDLLYRKDTLLISQNLHLSYVSS